MSVALTDHLCPLPSSLSAAINPKACQRDPAACAAVQRVLERVNMPHARCHAFVPTYAFTVLTTLLLMQFSGPDAHIRKRTFRARARAQAAAAAAAAGDAAALGHLQQASASAVSTSTLAATPLAPARRDVRAHHDRSREQH
jgi:hypothetical protein